MKKLVLLFILFWLLPIFAQDIPASYTTNLELRKYDLDDYPGADSLNANSDQIDAGWKEHEDTLAAIKADIYSVITYAGSLIDGVVYSADLNTELDTNLVKTHNTDIIYGQKTFAASTYTKSIIPLTDDTYYLGFSPLRWLRIFSKYVHAEEYYIVNSAGTDSASFSFSGGNFNIDKPLNVDDLIVGDSFTMDSSASFSTFNFEPNQYTVPSVGDTVLTLSTSDLYSSTELDLPGDVTPGISFMQIDTAPVGMVLRFYNGDASYTIIFEDVVSGDDNMYMAGDMTLGQYDSIEFECIDATKGAQKWIERGRSNN